MILPRTLSDTTGPAFVHGLVGKLDKDLTRQHSGEPLGERIIVTGRLTDGDGLFSFVRVNPGSVPDGSLQAPHVMVSVFARGLLKRLVTRIYFPDESDSNARDPVLSSMEDPEFRKTLVAHEEGGALRLDVHLQGDHQTAFFEL